LGASWIALMAPEPAPCPITDLLIHTGDIAVAPDLEEVVGQAHQPPFRLDLLQAAQAEAAETARAPLIWPNTGSTTPLRKP